MTIKKMRVKTARLYRRFGIDWSTSHKLARGFGLHIRDLDVTKVTIGATTMCGDHTDCYVTDKHGTVHLFRDGWLW